MDVLDTRAPYTDQRDRLRAATGVREERFPEFEYEDSIGYTFIGDLKAQRNELDCEINAILLEAIQRARAFIRAYKFIEKDVFLYIET